MNTKTNSRAFTLVELLSVILIIGALTGILLTSVASAKRKGLQVKCVSNLHQTAIAAAIYLDDFNERHTPTLRPLLDHNYISDPRVLICPSDKERHWGTAYDQNLPIPPQVTANYSFIHPFSPNWGPNYWNGLIRLGGAAGIFACQLHGEPIDGPGIYGNLLDYEGLTLRAQRDGAVVTRNVLWTQLPNRRRAANPWRLLADGAPPQRSFGHQ